MSAYVQTLLTRPLVAKKGSSAAPTAGVNAASPFSDSWFKPPTSNILPRGLCHKPYAIRLLVLSAEHLNILRLLYRIGRKVPDEQVIQELGGKDAHDRHAFTLAQQSSFLPPTFGKKA